MMGKWMLWFLISGKRCLKKPSFVITLLLLPLCLYGMSQVEKKQEQGILIALYDSETEFGRKIVDSLIGYEGMFTFYLCDSKEQLEEDVASRKAECGYVFPVDLEENLESGSFKRSIGAFSAPSTVTAGLCAEVVFAALIGEFGKTLYNGYMESSELFRQIKMEQLQQETENLYDKYQSNGSTFSFEYELVNSTGEMQLKSAPVFPVRGLVGVTIFVVGLFSAATLCRDEESGLFLTLPYQIRSICSGMTMLAPILLTSLSGLLSLMVSGQSRGFWQELISLCFYAVLILVWCWLLKVLIPNSTVLCCMIPFWIIGSLILCPVFLQIGTWIPELEWMGKCFPPYYYLTGML